MSRRAARAMALAAVLASAWLVSHGVAEGLDSVWLSLVPVLALVVSLVAGRYVGADALERLVAARRAPAAAAASTMPPRRRYAARHAHGGLLLACRLAGRAPPHAPLAA